MKFFFCCHKIESDRFPQSAFTYSAINTSTFINQPPVIGQPHQATESTATKSETDRGGGDGDDGAFIAIAGPVHAQCMS